MVEVRDSYESRKNRIRALVRKYFPDLSPTADLLFAIVKKGTFSRGENILVLQFEMTGPHDGHDFLRKEWEDIDLVLCDVSRMKEAIALAEELEKEASCKVTIVKGE